MRIISKTPDYYDNISHVFGQDPNVTYHRKNIDCKGISMRVGVYDSHCYARNAHHQKLLHNDYSSFGRSLKPYSICYTTVIAGAYTFKVGSEAEGNDEKQILEFSTALTPDEVKHLQKQVGVPVFAIHNVKHKENPGWVEIYIKSKVPNLKDLGISTLVASTQMWQSIYSCLTNVLRTDPDKQPPATLNNQEKIWASGFDEKVSFRHRKGAGK